MLCRTINYVKENVSNDFHEEEKRVSYAGKDVNIENLVDTNEKVLKLQYVVAPFSYAKLTTANYSQFQQTVDQSILTLPQPYASSNYTH